MTRAMINAPPLVAVLLVSLAGAAEPEARQVEHFEKKVRPLLVAHCLKCHGAEKTKGGLRLHSREALTRGGNTGPTLIPGKPDESLLIQAVRQSGELKMPPTGKLKEQEVADLVAWIKAGAVFPGGPMTTPLAELTPVRATTFAPNAPELAKHLQAWFKADTLPLQNDGQTIAGWPDSSGKGRNLTIATPPTGKPPRLVVHSRVNRRPAVRFEPDTVMTVPPVEINGDGAFTISLIVKPEPSGTGQPVVQVGDAELRLTDAALGKGTLANRAVLLTIVKTAGPMRTSTRLYVDGVLGAEPEEPARDAAMPRLRIGLKGFRGDLAEVIVYSKALADGERAAVEAYLADRYALVLLEMLRATEAGFTPEQKAFWAFQPVGDPPLPAVKDVSWAKSGLDRFILAKLEEKGLRPAAAADRRTLIRRVTYDLTGLPPSPEEVESAVNDKSADWYAKVVDRLLKSPHYGERWGRHWLDVVRYADTTANDANAVMRYAYRYRDYVVHAFNQDRPYDQFIVEQLAGDLLPDTTDISVKAERIIATGFLMIGPKALAETDKEQTRLDVVDEQLDVTTRAFLGLTVTCARCHDHKFDPIPTVDYYGLAGIFRGTEPFMDENRNATMWQEWSLFQIPGDKPFLVMAPKEGTPTNLKVHLRGSRFQLGRVAPRRLPQVVAGGNAALHSTESGRLELARWIASKEQPLTARVMVNRIWQHHFGTGLVGTSDNFGMRGDRPSHLELLDWLAARFVEGGWSIKAMHRLMLLSNTYQMACVDNAEAARRDPTNRLLWRMPRQRLEAEAIRDAVLAVSGKLERTVGGGEGSDFLYREAEIIDGRRGFAANRVKSDHPFYTTSPRRSLYLPVVRNMLPDVLALFDAADPNGVTAVRNDTTVPSQALFMLNHPFVREQALHFARSLQADAKVDDAERIRRAHLRAYGRPAVDEEVATGTAFLKGYIEMADQLKRPVGDRRLAAWQSYCQMLLCANEFMYVE